jgi:hypothetical protein
MYGNDYTSLKNCGAMANSATAFHIVNIGYDCPIFDGIFEFSSISAGGSICTAFLLCTLIEAAL